MEDIILVSILIVGLFVAIIVTRNDRDENYYFTKKGFIKLGVVIGLTLLAISLFKYYVLFM